MSVEAVRGRPLQGRSAMSVFSSLKYLTHRLTLLVRMQVCPYERWTYASICDAEIFSWTGSYNIKLCWKFMSYSYVADCNIPWHLLVIMLCSCLNTSFVCHSYT